MSFISKIALLVGCLWLSCGIVSAKNSRLEYIGQNPLRNGKPLKDTLPYLDVIERFTWDVTVNTVSGKTLQLTTANPDTLKFGEPFTLVLSATFDVNPLLLNKVHVLEYKLNGSLSVKLNGETLINTGTFASKTAAMKRRLRQSDFVDFVFKDTVERLEITYVSAPHINFPKLEMAFQQLSFAEKIKKNNVTEANTNFALGFYYLAFAIIFIIFFFFLRVRTENLYFSMFCLMASFSLLWDNMKLQLLPGFDSYLLVLSLEFLAIFFAKIIKNKEKSKVTLLVILVLTAVSYHPYILYNYSTFFNTQLPVIKSGIIVVMTTYTGISSLYYLIQGIGQKRWEARAIVVIISIAIILFFVLPLIGVSIIASRQSYQVISAADILHSLLNIGLCIYPLSAAIVLGRRNGLNQKQLIDQVKSIEKLSQENLEKERQQQLLLENQNIELERKVAERTSEVQSQKEQIEQKNKAITDNINYAQRIQSAILPDIQLIYKALEHSFILFLPKDIVSGDFYAFAEKNGRVLIIAGDCTGHGVSGAFMSMIGSSLLNQIINERGIYEPAAILTLLNTAVIDSLKQSTSESNDGMDISICSFDLVKNELHYAGANRPLWLLRAGNVEVFRPDKFPIGGLQAAKDRVFTNYEIPLQKNDSIYIFTDGYADQFGGENGKKLMTSKFKEKLISLQNVSMKEQEKILKDHFDNWKGSNEQVDDVLVIGVRV